MTNAQDTSTFTPIEKITLTDDLKEYRVYFNSSTGSGQYIAFKFGDGNNWEIFYLDDIVVETIPACDDPYSLSAYALTMQSIQLSWRIHGVTNGYNLEWGDDGFTLGEGNYVGNI